MASSIQPSVTNTATGDPEARDTTHHCQSEAPEAVSRVVAAVSKEERAEELTRPLLPMALVASGPKKILPRRRA